MKSKGIKWPLLTKATRITSKVPLMRSETILVQWSSYLERWQTGYTLSDQKPITVFLRATQGHSRTDVEAESTCTRITAQSQLPKFAVQGTFSSNWESIRVNGLMSGRTMEQSLVDPLTRTDDYGVKNLRNDIHFATIMNHDPNANLMGVRRAADHYIFLNLRKCWDDKIPLYLSPNGYLIVTQTLQPAYFLSVVNTLPPPPI